MNKLGYALRRNPAAAVGLVALAAWVVLALVGPSVLRFSHTAMDMESQLSAPGLNGHALGTDALGRDILSRIVYGSRSILSVALLTSLFSSVAGVALGFSAGYFGGKIDAAFMRFLDILMAIPPLVLSMVVLGALGDSSVGALTLIVSIAYTPATARVARSALLSCKAWSTSTRRACGASPTRTLCSSRSCRTRSAPSWSRSPRASPIRS